MLDRTDLEPLFFAPFVSSVMRVEPSWIDYNGHLNMAYYNVLFDRCVDEAYELLGIGVDYLSRQGHSTFTAEAHVRYLRELNEGDPVRVTFQLLDYDEKRIHYFQQLFHAACRHDGQEGRAVSRQGEAHALPHDGGACPPAPSRGRGPQHRDAGEGLRPSYKDLSRNLRTPRQSGGAVPFSGPTDSPKAKEW
jgi:acyl-CoA thioesterase FadM